jgi:hypothetical protein
MSINFEGKGTPITTADFQAAVSALACDSGSLWALLVVETRGFGFLDDRRPQMLFERHIFNARTGGQFSQSNSDISSPIPGGYVGGAGEYDRLNRAMALSEKAALESASWGLGQVMGFNAGKTGYADVYGMVSAMVAGEGAQLQATTKFITANPPLGTALRDGNWPRVAFYYNGKDYAKNNYDTKLEQHHEVFSNQANQPDLRVRTAQACLAYLGFLTSSVDGLKGPRTSAAIQAYRKAKGMSGNGELNDELLNSLRRDADI